MKIVAIVNPRSGGGSTARSWPALQRLLKQSVGDFEARFTDAPGAGIRLTREALRGGAKLVLSVGGDGTHNEVVNGFFAGDQPGEELLDPDAAFGLVPAGTGGDLRRSLHGQRDRRAAIAQLGRPDRQRVDLGRATFRTPDGGTGQRYFINVASFGVGGEVVARANASSKVLGGRISFTLASLRALAVHRDKRVRFALDDGPLREAVVTNVAICNGGYFGGGMWVSPTAKLDDGIFDVTVWSGLGLSDFILKSHRLYGGTHVTLKETTVARAHKLRAESEDRVLVELDGEQPGELPATFEVLPAALWVRGWT